MIIRKTCRAIAEGIMANIDHKEDNLDVRTLEKRLNVLAIYICSIVSLIIIGLWFNIWIDLLLASVTFVLVRINGGNHFDSPDMCFIVTTGSIVLGATLQHFLGGYKELAFIVCLIGYIIFSPHSRESSKNNSLIRKFILVSAFITSYFFNEDIFYTYLVLLPDSIIKNPIWNKWRVQR